MSFFDDKKRIAVRRRTGDGFLKDYLLRRCLACLCQFPHAHSCRIAAKWQTTCVCAFCWMACWESVSARPFTTSVGAISTSQISSEFPVWRWCWSWSRVPLTLLPSALCFALHSSAFWSALSGRTDSVRLFFISAVTLLTHFLLYVFDFFQTRSQFWSWTTCSRVPCRTSWTTTSDWGRWSCATSGCRQRSLQTELHCSRDHSRESSKRLLVNLAWSHRNNDDCSAQHTERRRYRRQWMQFAEWSGRSSRNSLQIRQKKTQCRTWQMNKLRWAETQRQYAFLTHSNEEVDISADWEKEVQATAQLPAEPGRAAGGRRRVHQRPAAESGRLGKLHRGRATRVD